MINEMIDLAEKIQYYASKFRVDELEFYLQSSRSLNIQNIQGYITTRTGVDVGIGIRAVIGKKIGFASTSSLDTEKVEDTIKNAAKIAKNKPEDPDFRGLPDPMKSNKTEGIFDERVENVDFDEIVKITSEIEKTVVSEPKISKFSFSLTLSAKYLVISNTRGILEEDKGTFVSGYVDVKAKENSYETSGLDYFTGRELDENRIVSMGKGAVKRALNMIGAKKLKEPFTGQLLLENRLVYDILRPLEYNISADNHQNKRSAWLGKLGEKVANENLTIIDDGKLKKGYMTMKIDGEGTPMQTKTIIQKGILKNLIYDSYSAKKENKKSTGNAIRGNYNTTPILTSTNIVMENGNKTIEELIQSIDRGIYATTFNMGAHMTDPIKGFFSLTNINSYYIKNGEIKYPLRSVNISGNFFDAIEKIVAIGRDRWYHYKGVFPSIIIDNISFV